jgi:hypothetical protein
MHPRISHLDLQQLLDTIVICVVRSTPSGNHIDQIPQPRRRPFPAGVEFRLASRRAVISSADGDAKIFRRLRIRLDCYNDRLTLAQQYSLKGQDQKKTVI